MSLPALLEAITAAPPVVSIAQACHALGVAPATFYRWKTLRIPSLRDTRRPCSVPGRALTQAERDAVVVQLDSARFQDEAVPQVYAKLLDEGIYLCSTATMYRILRERDEVHERRRQRGPSQATRPELLATGPNQVWSWDITKLKGPVKWSYFYLYVILDIYSRYVVGWCLVERESAEIAEALIQETLLRENVPAGQLTLHADRGSAMTSQPVSALLVHLGVERSHSRPHTSDDNPFSESHFKTMKYRPEMPERFGTIQEARDLFRKLFVWYNGEHRHSGIAMLTAEMAHTGKSAEVLAGRTQVLADAYAAHPERFVKRVPVPAPLPRSVWINPPLLPAQASRDASGEPPLGADTEPPLGADTEPPLGADTEPPLGADMEPPLGADTEPTQPCACQSREASRDASGETHAVSQAL